MGGGNIGKMKTNDYTPNQIYASCACGGSGYLKGKQGFWWIRCAECHVEGPKSKDKNIAIGLWNGGKRWGIQY